MKIKGNKHRLKFFFACIVFVLLIIIFLFSGTAVNKYYKIQTPKPDQVIESFPGFSQKAMDTESIKLLNWNVYKEKRQGWVDDFKLLAQGQDIILIQEARLKNKNREVFNIIGMGGSFARSFSYWQQTGIDTGVMTLSKARPVSSTVLRSRFKEPLTHTPKVSLLTQYSLKKIRKKLLVINTHGINFVKSAAFESQMAGLKKKIKRHQGPVIFAGDFNTWNKKRIFILRRITKQLEMREAVFYPDTRTKRFRYFLDHVFYKGLKIKQTKVFKDIKSSDHKALGVEFYFSGQ